MTNSHLDKLPQYGKLSGITIGSIRAMVEELIKGQFVNVTGGEYPVLRLSHDGVKALRERTPINLKTTKALNAKKPAKKETSHTITDTVEQTHQLISLGLSIEKIAEKRGMSPGTIYSHLAILIQKQKVNIEKILPKQIVDAVETAIIQTNQVERLALIKERLPQEISYDVIRCVVENWKVKKLIELCQLPENPEGHCIINKTRNEIGYIVKVGNERNEVAVAELDESIENFLSRDHPRQLSGPWNAGWSLGFHSRYQGSDWTRSPVGELAYRLKYNGDFTVITPLVQKMMSLIHAHPEIGLVDAVIPVPSSVQREKDPVSSLARELATQIKATYLPVLTKSRKTAEQKQFQTLAQKKANVADAFRLQSSIKGKRVLVLDDLFDSGATLEEITKLLKQAGADTVNVLTITRTIHSEH